MWNGLDIGVHGLNCPHSGYLYQRREIEVSSAVTNIRTGILMVMTQIAADELGLPIQDDIFYYGDSKMPFAPIKRGSFTVFYVGSPL